VARSFLCCGIALAAVLLLGAGPAPTGVDLTIENLRNARGILRLCVTSDPRYFPDCSDDPAAISRSVAATEHGATFDLPAGRYAVSLIHDENGNGKLDTTLGIPREGFAFSRNPAIRFGPPRYDEVSFPVGEARTGQVLRVKYLL
jgi:uncharacterized protein (DUF2141 family)